MMVTLVDLSKETEVLVQGITGREGRFHTKAMLDYGTNIVAGVTPGKGGASVHGVPVYDSVEEALEDFPNIVASVVFVPARYVYEAILESISAGIKIITVITEHIPVHDTAKLVRYAELMGSTIIGPNTPGLIVPGELKLGIMPGRVFKKGNIAVISRSGTLTYEIAYALTVSNMGQSIAVGIGGDPITGLTFIDVAETLRNHEETKAIVIIGEIGGDLEERFAEYIVETAYPKPVIAYIAGRTAPPEKRMGHAGAIISRGRGDAETKIKSLIEAGVKVAETPSQVPAILRRLKVVE